MANDSTKAFSDKLIKIDRRMGLQFKSHECQEIWYNWIEANSDRLEIVNYARRWAKYMQFLIQKKRQHLSEIAYQTSLDCDIDDCIGQEEYSAALEILIQCWRYGDNLEIYASRY